MKRCYKEMEVYILPRGENVNSELFSYLPGGIVDADLELVGDILLFIFFPEKF